MSKFDDAVREVVLGNRILADQDILDAYGHISVRHPEDSSRFLLSRSRSAALVSAEDIIEFGLDCEPVVSTSAPLYLERFIHGGAYRTIEGINCVIHGHTESLLPFGISDVPLRPVVAGSSGAGAPVPVWDIADKFGDSTNLLVTDLDKGLDLASAFGSSGMVLMRGHGFAAVGTSVVTTIRMCMSAARNARVLMCALGLGGSVKYLSPGEMAARSSFKFDTGRGWHSWSARVGFPV